MGLDVLGRVTDCEVAVDSGCGVGGVGGVEAHYHVKI